MPVVSIPLSSTEFSIFNSIYHKVISDVAERIEIDPKTLTVLYKNVEYTKTDNETNVSLKETENRPTTVSKRRFVVRVNQEYDEDTLGTTAVHEEEHYPIFQDRVIGVTISPVYIQMSVELEFQYLSPSKSELNTMRDMIRIHLSRMRNIGHHEVEYTMLIPDSVESFIEDIHGLRNRLIPQELAEYFLEHSSNRVHPITDMSNKENTKLGVKEKQVRIVGTYGFSPTPEKAENNTADNTNSFSFTYAFSVTIPRALSVRYPPIICNKILPAKYLSFVEEARKKDYLDRNRNMNYIGHSNYALSSFEAHRQLENMVNINLPINVPLFDEFYKKQGHKGYGIVMSFLIEVDETNKKGLLNLKDLGPYNLSTTTLDFIKNSNKDNFTQPYRSFIYFGLHQDDRHFDNSVLEITEDLDVRSKVELSLLTPVRVTISLCIDLSMLGDDVLDPLQKTPEVFIDFFKDYLENKYAFNEYLKSQGPAEASAVHCLIKFIRELINKDDKENIRDILRVVARYDNLLASCLAEDMVTYRPEIVNYLKVLGIVIFRSGSNFVIRVDQELPKEGKGEPIYPKIGGREFGIINYPEYD